MADHKTSDTKTPFINNPFFVAAEGIKLFFVNAMGIAILLVILSALSSINPADLGSSSSTQSGSGAVNPAVIIGVAVLVVIASIAIIIIGTIISGITSYSAAKVSHNETATLKEAWQATWQNFGSYLWLQAIIVFKVAAWSLLFIIPGVIMYYRYSLANIAFFDKGVRGNAAIKESLTLTKGSWLLTFSSQLLFTIATLGTLSKLVAAGATAVLYRQFQVTPQEERPKAHGLSIATLILAIIGALAIVTLIVLLGHAIINYAINATS